MIKHLSSDPRDRLSDPSNDGRLAHYRVALDQFGRTPLLGSGAGSFEITWSRHRADVGTVRDGHTLYLEVLGELGLVGLLLVSTAILAILVGLGRRVRGADRILYATLFAAALTWAGAAGIDWHWEMPVVTFWFFALGGAALARGERERERGVSRRGSAPMWARIAIAGACCALALPVRIAISQDRVESALDTFVTGRCGDAESAAHDSLRAVGSRAQPYEILAYCALADGNDTLAVARMAAAARRDGIRAPRRSARMVNDMTITIGNITFDHATYDDRGDVLYLHVGARQPAADSLGTPEGHAVRYNARRRLAAI